jgi:hypothetical protein
MRIKFYILVVLVSALFAGLFAANANDHTPQDREYHVKAAFLYNFIKFVDWPEAADSNDTITIGLIGDCPFGDAFEPIKTKKIREKAVVIRAHKSFEELKAKSGDDKGKAAREIQALRKCHLLFICSSEKDNVGEVLDVVKDSCVLTVGEMDNFLEAGGIINFLMEEKKVRFEVNITAAEEAKLKIRSKLLRLAKRVVKEEGAQEKSENRAEASEETGN